LLQGAVAVEVKAVKVAGDMEMVIMVALVVAAVVLALMVEALAVLVNTGPHNLQAVIIQHSQGLQVQAVTGPQQQLELVALDLQAVAVVRGTLLAVLVVLEAYVVVVAVVQLHL
jgi:hypothetical protein